MNESSSRQAETAVAGPSIGILIMAVLAPFGAIALLASPLFVDVIRHIAGI
jgi:hypothetical protein